MIGLRSDQNKFHSHPDYWLCSHDENYGIFEPDPVVFLATSICHFLKNTLKFWITWLWYFHFQHYNTVTPLFKWRALFLTRQAWRRTWGWSELGKCARDVEVGYNKLASEFTKNLNCANKPFQNIMLVFVRMFCLIWKCRSNEMWTWKSRLCGSVKASW